ANLRTYFAFMFDHPGKILLFMWGEFAREREWNHDHSLDCHLLDQPLHRVMQALVCDLNRLYGSTSSLHERDAEPEGFEWMVADDSARSVFAWVRRGRKDGSLCLVVANFTPVVHQDYRVPVPTAGPWREVLNTDSEFYGGSNVGNSGQLTAAVGETGAPELSLTLPPLGALFLVPG